MTEFSEDTQTERILAGVQAGYAAAIRRAQETGTPLVIWENGQILKISAAEALRRQGGCKDNSEQNQTIAVTQRAT